MGVVNDVILNGVYSLARYAANYPMVLDLTYPISQRSAGEFVLDGLEIGSVLVAGDDIFVAWYDRNTSTYGVDKIDYTTKLDGAYFDSILRSAGRSRVNNYTNFVVAYCDLPTGCDIKIYYNTDYGTTWKSTTDIVDTDRNIVESRSDSVTDTVVQMRVKAVTSVNTAPVVESAGIFYS